MSGVSGMSIRNPDLSLTVITDYGDGTGLREDFDPDGTLVSTEALTLPPSTEPTPEERIAQLEALLSILLGVEP